MSKSRNPRGGPGKLTPMLRDQHVRFIGECAANLYNAGECTRMLKEEFGVDVTHGNIRHYYDKIKEFADKVRTYLEEVKDSSPESIRKAVDLIKEVKGKDRLSVLLDAYFQTKKIISESPTYGVAYADKRRRLLKLDQNIRELDEKKTAIKGSYPLSKSTDGSMEYKEFDVSNKDHAEQRKHLEAMGDLVDGQVGGDIIINVHRNEPTEDTNTPAEIERKKKMAEIRAKKEAGKPVTVEPTEVESTEDED